jgi:hypothetical protein
MQVGRSFSDEYRLKKKVYASIFPQHIPSMPQKPGLGSHSSKFEAL